MRHYRIYRGRSTVAKSLPASLLSNVPFCDLSKSEVASIEQNRSPRRPIHDHPADLYYPHLPRRHCRLLDKEATPNGDLDKEDLLTSQTCALLPIISA